MRKPGTSLSPIENVSVVPIVVKSKKASPKS